MPECRETMRYSSGEGPCIYGLQLCIGEFYDMSTSIGRTGPNAPTIGRSHGYSPSIGGLFARRRNRNARTAFRLRAQLVTLPNYAPSYARLANGAEKKMRV